MHEMELSSNFGMRATKRPRPTTTATTSFFSQDIICGRLGCLAGNGRRDSSAQITTIDAAEELYANPLGFSAGSSAANAPNKNRRRSSLAQLGDMLSNLSGGAFKERMRERDAKG